MRPRSGVRLYVDFRLKHANRNGKHSIIAENNQSSSGKTFV